MLIDSIVTASLFGFNWIDFVFLALILYFVYSSSGLVDVVLETLGFILSLFISYALYQTLGNFLFQFFSIPHGIANALGYFIVWFVVESILFITVAVISATFLRDLQRNHVNRALGYGAATIHASMIFLFLVSLVFVFPSQPSVKKSILDSRSGPLFVYASQYLEKSVKGVFGDAINETINFLTVKSESGDTIDLGFKLTDSQMSIDSDSEIAMFTLVNKERVKAGLSPLRFNESLRALGRSYAVEMMSHGFFSHTSAIDKSTPGERAQKAGVEYQVFGENLAFSPDVYLAHQGLMNSPGHRANILSTEYKEVGIGVIDGGIYGKMFVQEFRTL